MHLRPKFYDCDYSTCKFPLLILAHIYIDIVYIYFSMQAHAGVLKFILEKLNKLHMCSLLYYVVTVMYMLMRA